MTTYSRLAQLIDRSWAHILDAGISRRARRGCRYHAYLPDRLTDLNVSLPADVAADVSDAERGVQDLNTSGPQLASLEALAHLLLRAEAVASSRIEGLEVGIARLARAEAPSRWANQ